MIQATHVSSNEHNRAGYIYVQMLRRIEGHMILENLFQFL